MLTVPCMPPSGGRHSGLRILPSVPPRRPDAPATKSAVSAMLRWRSGGYSRLLEALWLSTPDLDPAIRLNPGGRYVMPTGNGLMAQFLCERFYHRKTPGRPEDSGTGQEHTVFPCRILLRRVASWCKIFLTGKTDSLSGSGNEPRAPGKQLWVLLFRSSG